MRIVITRNDLPALKARLTTAATTAKPKFSQVIHRNAVEGNTIAQQLARMKAGPHGSAYWKRLSAEMIGPLSAEYGPEGTPKTNFVGAGFRHGVNTDLPQSADFIGPQLAREIGETAEELLG